MDTNILYLIPGSIIIGLLAAQYSMHILKKECRILSARCLILTVVHIAIWLVVSINHEFGWVLLLYLLASSALLCLSVVDWCSYEIPIQFNYFIFGLGIIRVILDYSHWLDYVIGMVLVSGLFYIIVLVTKGRGMGGGDVKLMFTVGLLLGWKKILLVMLLGSVLGSVIHIIIMKVMKKDKMLAFGPYLSAGAVIAMAYGDQIINWYLQLYNFNVG